MTVSDLWVLMSLFRSVILLPLIGNRQTLTQSSTKNNIKTVKPTHNNHKNVKSLKHQVIRHSKDRRLQQEQAESLFSVNTADFVFALHFILSYFILFYFLRSSAFDSLWSVLFLLRVSSCAGLAKPTGSRQSKVSDHLHQWEISFFDFPSNLLETRFDLLIIEFKLMEKISVFPCKVTFK